MNRIASMTPTSRESGLFDIQSLSQFRIWPATVTISQPEGRYEFSEHKVQKQRDDARSANFAGDVAEKLDSPVPAWKAISDAIFLSASFVAIFAFTIWGMFRFAMESMTFGSFDTAQFLQQMF